MGNTYLNYYKSYS